MPRRPATPVNFRLGLPVKWNGKFYFQGVGSLGGSIASLNTGLARGYASTSGPNSFEMLTVLEDWIERGVAPTRVVASHSTDGRVDRTRPLCPHPQVAKYAGSGSIDEAASSGARRPRNAWAVVHASRFEVLRSRSGSTRPNLNTN